jgi:hypothetical protein
MYVDLQHQIYKKAHLFTMPENAGFKIVQSIEWLTDD